jgi:hypothetical protein
VFEDLFNNLRIIDKSGDTHLGNTYRYIEEYANEMKQTPIAASMQVLDETEQVLNLILGKEAENRLQSAKQRRAL